MRYIGNLEEFKKLRIVEERAVKIFLGSIKKYKPLDLCLQGVAVEEAVRQNLKLNFAEDNIYEYDLIDKNNKKFEIKSKKYSVIPEWWSFNDYDYFLSVSKNIDFIIFCPIIENNIYIKYIANAKNFESYISKSIYNKKDKQYYYNNKKAINNKHCIELN